MFEKLIESFIKPLGISDEIYPELLKFQMNAIKLPFENGKEFECNYDFAEYFRSVGSENGAVLESKPVKYTFTAPKKYENWVDFAKETVWYGRRKGATLYTNNASSITKGSA